MKEIFKRLDNPKSYQLYKNTLVWFFLISAIWNGYNGYITDIDPSDITVLTPFLLCFASIAGVGLMLVPMLQYYEVKENPFGFIFMCLAAVFLTLGSINPLAAKFLELYKSNSLESFSNYSLEVMCFTIVVIILAAEMCLSVVFQINRKEGIKSISGLINALITIVAISQLGLLVVNLLAMWSYI